MGSQDRERIPEGGLAAFFGDRSTAGSEEAYLLYRLLYDESPGFSFSVDPSDALLTINRLGAESLGYSVEELVGRPVTHLIHPDEQSALRRQLAECRREPGRVFQGHFRKLRKDGSPLWVRESARAVKTHHQVVVLVSCQDITEQRHLEEQLRQQFAQLQELDRLKTNFVNSVTHELRTPLTSIMGYAEFLEDGIGGKLTPEQLTFVLQLQEGAHRLERLLNDLLDFARLEAGTFRITLQEADMAQTVRDVARSLLPQAIEAQLHLRASIPEEPLMLPMDAQRIGQVLTNLIGNSIKFTPPGGTICLRVRPIENWVHCEVQDSGVGIPEADLPKLFNRFTQLDAGLKRGVGAGLGLSISKAIVEAHGGRIGVLSQEGKGSTFWFDLPLNPPDVAPS